MELKRCPGNARFVNDLCTVLDTLAMARSMHPGQRNSLDALCKRYEVDNSHRELHGALLDARLLVDVYLAMTGGQGALTLGGAEAVQLTADEAAARAARPAIALLVIRASEEELIEHERYLGVIGQASGGRCLWRTLVAPTALPRPADLPVEELSLGPVLQTA
jgi:DNA polymerase-3 subunit epsilon